MIETYLEHTSFDILIGTNQPDEFKEYGERVKVHVMIPSEFDQEQGDKRNIDLYEDARIFKYTSKFDLLRVGASMDYDVYYSLDADSFIDGWDQESFEDLVNSDVDVSVGHMSYNVSLEMFPWHPSRISNFNDNRYTSNIPERVYHPKVVSARNRVERGCREDRVIFTSKDALVKCLNVIDKIYTLPKYRDIDSYKYGIDGMFYSIVMIATRLNFQELERDTYKFADYEYTETSQGKVVDRWWEGGHYCFKMASDKKKWIDDEAKLSRTKYYRDYLGLS